MAETYVLAMRCPVLRRRDSHSGSCTELENLDSDGKGKGTSGSRHSIRARDLTDEAFAPYGDIIKPRMSGEQFDHTHSYDPS